jgi:hypothetical protein
MVLSERMWSLEKQWSTTQLGVKHTSLCTVAVPSHNADHEAQSSGSESSLNECGINIPPKLWGDAGCAMMLEVIGRILSSVPNIPGNAAACCPGTWRASSVSSSQRGSSTYSPAAGFGPVRPMPGRLALGLWCVGYCAPGGRPSLPIQGCNVDGRDNWASSSYMSRSPFATTVTEHQHVYQWPKIQRLPLTWAGVLNTLQNLDTVC